MSQGFCEHDHAYVLSSVWARYSMFVHKDRSHSRGLKLGSKLSGRLFNTCKWKEVMLKHTAYLSVIFSVPYVSNTVSQSFGFGQMYLLHFWYSIIRWPFKRQTYEYYELGPNKWIELKSTLQKALNLSFESKRAQKQRGGKKKPYTFLYLISNTDDGGWMRVKKKKNLMTSLAL